MAYEVYVNHPNNKAIIHDAACRTLRQHGGVSSTYPPSGYYSGVIEDLDEAWAFARGTNKAEIRTHRVCLGQLTPGSA